MKTLFSVPNLLSLGNLLCGCIAILNVIDGNIGSAVYLVMLACVFDFLDGFAARGLKQGSPMGKELDSLADMVTFGVVPGMVMFQLIRYNLTTAYPSEFVEFGIGGYDLFEYLPYCGFIIPLFSGLRLAKFNVDTRQSESFFGFLRRVYSTLLINGLRCLRALCDGINHRHENVHDNDQRQCGHLQPYGESNGDSEKNVADLVALPFYVLDFERKHRDFRNEEERKYHSYSQQHPWRMQHADDGFGR